MDDGRYVRVFRVVAGSLILVGGLAIAAAVWWRLWMYSAWPEPFPLTRLLVVSTGEGYYDLVFLDAGANLVLLLVVVLGGRRVAHWLARRLSASE